MFPALPSWTCVLSCGSPLPDTACISSQMSPELYALLVPLSYSNDRLSSGSYVVYFSMGWIFPFKFQNWTWLRVQFLPKCINAIFSLQQNYFERGFPWIFILQLLVMHKHEVIESSHKQTTEKKYWAQEFSFQNTNRAVRHTCFIGCLQELHVQSSVLFYFVLRKGCHHLQWKGTFTYRCLHIIT